MNKGIGFRILRCGGATQMHRINEVYIGGEDTASTPTQMILARTSTISVGALSVGNLALADFVGTTRPRISAFMNRFRDEGLIDWTADRFVMVRVDRLSAYLASPL